MNFDPQKVFMNLMDLFFTVLPEAPLTYLLMAEAGPAISRVRYTSILGAESSAAFLLPSYLFGQVLPRGSRAAPSVWCRVDARIMRLA